MAFVHLHTHTEYSLLDGSNKVKEYVKRCKELGMTAAAITDHGNMYGVIEFYLACEEEGIKPVIGCEVYVAPGSRFDKSAAGEDSSRYYHLILLAENNTGYQNLSHIVSRGFTEGYYYKPRVDKELLREFHEGIICCSACLAGEIARDIVKGDLSSAKEAALEYQDIFGKGNFFLELQDHGYSDQQTVNAALLSMSQELDIPLVATNDCHYTYKEDAEAHDVLLCIQTAKKVTDEQRMRYPGGQFYVKAEEEMRKLFPYAQQAIDNTVKIADRCNVTIEFGKTKLPHFDVPEGYDSWTYLNYLCENGFKKNYPDDDGTVYKRMQYELGVIKSMGFVDYFLIVWDYINWSREHDISVGPGRGSAAGSVVSYCIGITQLDPIKYDLLFERFLNPERVSMPDIDVDFEYERRQEVIEYVTKKYGSDCVVQIVTFGTMAAKGVVKDVGRAMDLPYNVCDNISKKIPNEKDMTLEKAFEEVPELNKLYKTDMQIKKLVDIAIKLEGLPRHTSVHAAGVVICAEPAENLIPLQTASDGSVTTQFTMTRVEQLGLLKMDFLGLRTLGVIKNAARLSGVNMDDISYDDPAVYASIGSGKTDGVFQLESGGMQSFMKELRPGNLEDVIAGIALYRPGPMDFIPKYIGGKRSHGKVSYETPELKPILSPTYGCIVYQEQVMQIVQNLGGYSLGRADLVRRAMSKKKAAVMEAERQNFVYGSKEENVPGCISKGISEDVANHIYDTMIDFAKYAFNKSHAACYAVVTYQTAWLKHYHPVEYMAALITSVIDKPDKTAGYILSCRKMGIPVLPPDINEGEASFSVSNGCVRYALTAVKGVGTSVVNDIVADRTQNGKFRDLKDFLTRSSVNKRVVEGFIKSGAFDCFGKTRQQLMLVYENLMDELATTNRKNIPGQMSMFDLMADDARKQFEVAYPNVGEYDRTTQLSFEKEVLGVYVSGHPLDAYENIWTKHIKNKAVEFQADDNGLYLYIEDGKRTVVGGIITQVNARRSKTGKMMAILTIEDLTGSLDIMVFPKVYDRVSSLIEADAKVFVHGRVSVDGSGHAKVIADSVETFDAAKKQTHAPVVKKQKLWVRFKNKSDYEDRIAQLYGLIETHKGNVPVVVFLSEERSMKDLPSNLKISGDSDVTNLLSIHFGKENIVLQ